jgi:primosomal protein N' (replication factor Y)
VAGRAGRGELPGRVIIQTLQPEHYALAFALKQDFEGFYQQELQSRKAFFYPPFARIANLRLAGRAPQAVKTAAPLQGQAGRRLVRSKAFAGHVRLLGPARAPLARLKGKERWMLLVKADTPSNMSRFLSALLEKCPPRARPGGADLEIDRDPAVIM